MHTISATSPKLPPLIDPKPVIGKKQFAKHSVPRTKCLDHPPGQQPDIHAKPTPSGQKVTGKELGKVLAQYDDSKIKQQANGGIVKPTAGGTSGGLPGVPGGLPGFPAGFPGGIFAALQGQSVLEAVQAIADSLNGAVGGVAQLPTVPAVF